MSDLSPCESAELFPDATPEQRAEVLMKAGHISVDAMPYVIAHIRYAEEAIRGKCLLLVLGFEKTVSLHQAFGVPLNLHEKIMVAIEEMEL